MSAAIDLKIAQLKVEQLTPDIYDCFERDPSKALLLLHHNTNLRSFPALEKLRNTPTAQRLAEPDMFDDLIQTCKVEVSSLTNSILEARHTQLSGYYDARNPLAPLHSCASCGRREISKPLLPHERVSLEDLEQVYEYEAVLAKSDASPKASVSAAFTRQQLSRIASDIQLFDSISSVTSDKMLDYY